MPGCERSDIRRWGDRVAIRFLVEILILFLMTTVTMGFTCSPVTAWGGVLAKDTNGKAASKGSVQGRSNNPKLTNPISPDDYRPVAIYKRSYLAANSSGKKLLYLEGDAYERGYAEGYLCPRSVYRMTHDYVDNFIKGLVKGLAGPGGSLAEAPFFVQTVRRIMAQAVLSQEHAVPEEFRREMQGIAAGCQDRGFDVTYKDVFLINVGFDFLYSLVYQGGSLLCNEFSVFGKGTRDGRLFHGRDFMFTTGGDVFSDEALLMVHKPTDGFPLVASAAPGFVGFPTALNTQGISFGMDMVPNRQNRALVSGMGCLLLCRQVTQYASDLQEAIEMVRNTSRGVSWLFMIADGKNPDAVVLETVADRLTPEGNDLLLTLLGLLPGLSTVVDGAREALPAQLMDGTGKIITGAGDLLEGTRDTLPVLGDVHPDRGVAVRAADYVDPEGLEQYRIVIPAQDPLVPEREETVVSAFPLQREREPGLVAMTNHYILPRMNLTQMGLFYHTIDTQQGGGRESEWRYDTMLDLILERYGAIDRLTAMWLIDFLNPARCGYYGTDTSQSVKGHHVLMDNHSLEIWSLHGYYDDPWQHVDLKKVLGLPKPPPPNAFPVAVIRAGTETAKAGEEVTLDGSASYDPDGKIVSWYWDFGDGESAAGKTVSHAFTSEGLYTVTLTVMDDRGAKDSISRKIEIDEAPSPVSGYAIAFEKDVLITMSDGVKLAADIYRPEDEGSFPALLVMTPYRKDVIADSLAYHKNFVPEGYACVYVDIRGTGNSQGEWTSFGDVEGEDGYQVVEWVAHQPWCDGNVGMLGPSYMGIIQLFVAGKRPPHLKAIFPMVAMSDAYSDIVYQGGALDAEFIPSWLVLVTALGLIPPTYTLSEPLVAITALSQHISQIPEIGFWVLNNYRYNEFFEERSPQRVWDDIHVPMFVTAGWFDLFTRGSLRNFENIDVPKKLLVGEWYHMDGSSMKGVGAFQIQKRWFDYWLKGIDNGIMNEPPVTLYVMGENRWRTEGEWPLARARYVDFYLNGKKSGSANSLNDGSLSTMQPMSGEAPDVIAYDPTNGALSRSSVRWQGGSASGMPTSEDDRVNELKCLTYTTDVLSEDLEVTGPIRMKLYASTYFLPLDVRQMVDECKEATGVNLDESVVAESLKNDVLWVVNLQDVFPDGRSRNITSGWLLSSHRKSRTDFQSPLPGMIYEYDIEIWPTCNVFKKGHRIRIDISNSDFPHLAPVLIPSLSLVFHNAEYPSRITLPVVDAPRSDQWLEKPPGM